MLRFLFGFHGRINRAKFWIFYLAGSFGLSLAMMGLLMLETALTKAVPAFSFFDGQYMHWPQSLAGKAVAVAVIAAIALFFFSLLTFIVRRLHDRGKSAWWLAFFYGAPLAGFAAIFFAGFPADHPSPLQWGLHLAVVLALQVVIWWYLIELLFLPGTKGENRFGPDPRAPKPAN